MPNHSEGMRPRSRGRGVFQKVFTLAVSVLALWFLWDTLTDVGFRQFAHRIGEARVEIILLAVVLTVVRYIMLALRWEILARREAPVGLKQMVPVLMAGNFLSLVTPVVRIAGPILRAYYLSKETGRARSRFYGTIVADQSSNFSIYAVAMAVSGVFVTTTEMSISPVVGGAMLAALVGGLSVAGLMLRQVEEGKESRTTRILKRLLRPEDGTGWRGRVVVWWENLVHALSRSVIGTGAWWPSLFVSAIVFALVVAVQSLGFVAIGEQVGVMQVVFLVSGAGFLQVMTAAPGGPGVTEATLIVVALGLGIDKESATVGTFLARFISYAVLVPWGGIAFYRLQRKYGMPRGAAGEAPA